MKLIDADKLLEKMDERYNEKKNIVSNTLAEGFMQLDTLIHEQVAFDLEMHDNNVRRDLITQITNHLAEVEANIIRQMNNVNSCMDSETLIGMQMGIDEFRVWLNDNLVL